MQRIIKAYFERLFSNKVQNLKEKGKFLSTCVPPKVNQEDINRLNRSITCNETQVMIINLPTNNESQGLVLL